MMNEHRPTNKMSIFDLEMELYDMGGPSDSGLVDTVRRNQAIRRELKKRDTRRTRWLARTAYVTPIASVITAIATTLIVLLK